MPKLLTGKIPYNYRNKIKFDFFLGNNVKQLAEKYNLNATLIKRFVEGRATKTYISPEGIEYRRCSSCSKYKTTVHYNTRNGKTGRIYIANCKYCYNLIRKNKRIFKNNIGDDSELKVGRKRWQKNKFKSNIKRKVKRIIGYTNRAGKVIQKKDQK